MEITNRESVVEKDICVAGVGDRESGMFSVAIQRAGDKVMAYPDATGDMLSVWHEGLAQTGRERSGINHGVVLVTVLKWQ